MKRSIFWAVLSAGILFLLSGASAGAQDFNKAKLDSVLVSLEKNNKFMGGIALMRDGQLIYAKNTGFSDVAKQTKANENTRYRIGSITKTFTAVLVMKANEEGRLSLDETLDKYFPGIANAAKITIRHLLTHRSGIHNFTNDASYQTWYTAPKTRSELVKTITDAGSDFEPGSKFSYSNSGFVLLSFILEDIYKTSYAHLVQEKIVKPLGLLYTSVGGKINAEANEARSYTFTQGWTLEKETDMSVPMGAGAIVSTPTDLVRFSEALFSGKLVGLTAVEEMKKLKDNVGSGLITFPFYDRTEFGHSGGIDGFSSLFSYDPEKRIAFAMISNGMNYNGNDLTIAALSAAYNKPYQVPLFSSYKATEEELDKLLGNYTSKEIGLKITIAREGTTLFAKIEGQGSRPLAAIDKNKFADDAAGVNVVFQPEQQTFTLSQHGRSFNFSKAL